jgi:hypothetical protein
VLVCFFHHRLVHEHGWKLDRDEDGGVQWRRPDGRVHEFASMVPRPRAIRAAAPARAGPDP